MHMSSTRSISLEQNMLRKCIPKRLLFFENFKFFGNSLGSGVEKEYDYRS